MGNLALLVHQDPLIFGMETPQEELGTPAFKSVVEPLGLFVVLGWDKR